jgi:hypothetical protein
MISRTKRLESGTCTCLLSNLLSDMWLLLLKWAESRDDEYPRKSPYLLYGILTYLKGSKNRPFELTDADQKKIETYKATAEGHDGIGLIIEGLVEDGSHIAPKLQEWLYLAVPSPKSVVKNVSPALKGTTIEKFPSGWMYDSDFLSTLDRDEMISILNHIANQETGILDL